MRLFEISINKQMGLGITTLMQLSDMQLTGFVCTSIPCKWNQSLQKENIGAMPVGDMVFEKLQYRKGYIPIYYN